MKICEKILNVIFNYILELYNNERIYRLNVKYIDVSKIYIFKQPNLIYRYWCMCICDYACVRMRVFAYLFEPIALSKPDFYIKRK